MLSSCVLLQQLSYCFALCLPLMKSCFCTPAHPRALAWMSFFPMLHRPFLLRLAADTPTCSAVSLSPMRLVQLHVSKLFTPKPTAHVRPLQYMAIKAMQKKGGRLASCWQGLANRKKEEKQKVSKKSKKKSNIRMRKEEKERRKKFFSFVEKCVPEAQKESCHFFFFSLFLCCFFFDFVFQI